MSLWRYFNVSGGYFEPIQTYVDGEGGGGGQDPVVAAGGAAGSQLLQQEQRGADGNFRLEKHNGLNSLHVDVGGNGAGGSEVVLPGPGSIYKDPMGTYHVVQEPYTTVSGLSPAAADGIYSSEIEDNPVYAINPLVDGLDPPSGYFGNLTNGSFANDTGLLPGAGGGGMDLGLAVESQVTLIILYTLTTTLAVVGNILVILVFTLGKRSRSDLRGFLINLAVSDLIMAVFCMPFTFTMTMLSNWVFSAPMCPIVLFMQTVSVTASVCTNMAIGIDRFWVVTFPLKSRITKARSKFVIATIWIIACGLSSIQLYVGRSSTIEIAPGVTIADCNEIWPEPSFIWRRFYTFFILILTYLMPLTILSLTYGIVGTKLWQRTTPGNADEQRDMQQLKSKRKVIKMLVVVVVLFGICWLPLHVFILVIDFNPHLIEEPSPELQKIFTALYYTVHWLAMSNSFVNPIIYGFLNDSFRADLKRLWRKWFPCCKVCPCLRITWAQESTVMVKDYSRCDRRHSSSGSGTQGTHIKMSDQSKKLLSVKMNGHGSYETKLNGRNPSGNSLLVKQTGGFSSNSRLNNVQL